MATTRIMPLHIGKGRTVRRAIRDIIGYVKNPEKTDDGRLVTSYACDSRTEDAEFLLAKRQYIAATGRVRGKDDVIAYHLRQSLKDVTAVLSGEKEHTPRKKPVAAVPAAPKINLLVDIQAKLQAGKGMGYANWAKTFNLKQMAQTMMYLFEHNLMDYAVLKEKTSLATARSDALSVRIKAAENRMTEIAELRTQIINYAKTREVYEAYRKAGYSKKFLAEHEGDILLHKAAKAAFDQRGLKKLPKVKELSAEYQELLTEKRKLYPEYRRARDEMRELLTVKANVDRIMNQDKEKEKKKDRQTDRG